MRIIKKSFDGKNREENEFGDVEFPNATLICPGAFRDSYSRKEIYYSSEILKGNATNWDEPIFLTLDHSQSVLDRVGYVKDPHWNGSCVVGNLIILPITQKSRDAINLINNNMITDLSIEAVTNEEYDIIKKGLVLTDIKFKSVSLVVQGACPDAKISN